MRGYINWFLVYSETDCCKIADSCVADNFKRHYIMSSSVEVHVRARATVGVLGLLDFPHFGSQYCLCARFIAGGQPTVMGSQGF
jgi:hypothetical protein